ncbi:uncharacterized protein PHACADRAFT_263481 [Phanerochaete carnosa HHB-10118-sp]|uniref:Uncharacterized protein n=1 Tax=Phanerochaete carnosa (strain HHB-10118-sp) TaxID=650164 RepID=K5VX78_PHACS|nr:uncharacterized protein PHACADRAFT_263481 [Phanerochaete carnosa HHB-10118-sp]EKM51395.1 hypothetical protein PHACADRAFT_263481 [Phanerochaete carnosa HHB-10118-sp]
MLEKVPQAFLLKHVGRAHHDIKVLESVRDIRMWHVRKVIWDCTWANMDPLERNRGTRCRSKRVSLAVPEESEQSLFRDGPRLSKLTRSPYVHAVVLVADKNMSVKPTSFASSDGENLVVSDIFIPRGSRENERLFRLL